MYTGRPWEVDVGIEFLYISLSVDCQSPKSYSLQIHWQLHFTTDIYYRSDMSLYHATIQRFHSIATTVCSADGELCSACLQDVDGTSTSQFKLTSEELERLSTWQLDIKRYALRAHMNANHNDPFIHKLPLELALHIFAVLTLPTHDLTRKSSRRVVCRSQLRNAFSRCGLSLMASESVVDTQALHLYYLHLIVAVWFWERWRHLCLGSPPATGWADLDKFHWIFYRNFGTNTLVLKEWATRIPTPQLTSPISTQDIGATSPFTFLHPSCNYCVVLANNKTISVDFLSRTTDLIVAHRSRWNWRLAPPTFPSVAVSWIPCHRMGKSHACNAAFLLLCFANASISFNAHLIWSIWVR